jgi:N-acetylmuramoyl-L-alanine amidase
MSYRYSGIFDYRSAASHLAWLVLLVLACVPTTAYPAQRTSVEEPVLVRKVIVVDPGHGGHDLGAVGPSGLTEKVVTLSIARKIRDILSVSHEVHLTRDDDYSVAVERRTELANHYRADIFMSIHAGGAFGHQGRGTVIFYHRHRNTDSGFTPYRQYKNSWEIAEKPILWDDIQGKHTAKSQRLARLVHRHLLGRLSPDDKGVREAPLLVLQGADVPAILLEIAHLSHPAEEAELRKPEVMSAAAEAICEAIREYFNEYP